MSPVPASNRSEANEKPDRLLVMPIIRHVTEEPTHLAVHASRKLMKVSGGASSIRDLCHTRSRKMMSKKSILSCLANVMQTHSPEAIIQCFLAGGFSWCTISHVDLFREEITLKDYG